MYKADHESPKVMRLTESKHYHIQWKNVRYRVTTLHRGKGARLVRDLLTIKDAAEIANVTTQAIYQRLKKDLKPYVRAQNGRKMLTADVVKVLNKEPSSFGGERAMSQSSELLRSTMDVLMEQLAIKDAQIVAFQEEVIKQNGHAREQSDKLIALVEQVNDLQKNNQILLKMEQDRSALHHGGSERKKKRGWFSRLFFPEDDG